MKQTKRAFSVSIICLLLCFAMLIGTTYAWFTDSVTSGKNKIVAGNLDVELYHTNSETPTAETVEGETDLFPIDLWEPGVIAYENFEIKNEGNLAFIYNCYLNLSDYNFIYGDDEDYHSLYEVLKVAVIDGEFDGDRSSAQALSFDNKIYQVAQNGHLLPDMPELDESGALLDEQTIDANSSKKFAVVIYWEPSDDDNTFNLNNGKHSYEYDYSSGGFTDTGSNPLFLEFGIKLTATQYTYEEDSFDEYYDLQDSVVIGDFSGLSEAKQFNNTSDQTYTITNNNKEASATVFSGTQLTDENGSTVTESDKVQLKVEPDGNEDGVTINTGESLETYDFSLIRIATTSGDTETKTEIKNASEPVLVGLPIGIVDLQNFYHHGIELTKVNAKDDVSEDKYYYDVDEGTVYFKTKSFSPFTSVYYLGGGLGTEEHPYEIETPKHWNEMDAVYYYNRETGKTNNKYYSLSNDIDFAGEAPNGYIYSESYIVIDGNNHTISNATGPLFAQNWIYDVTLKNVTLKDCVSDYSLLCRYGSYYVLDKQEFTNVDVVNCTAKGGSFFLPWVHGEYTVTFTNCDITGSTLNNDTAAQGFVAGFVGNSKKTVTIDNCTLSADISSADIVAPYPSVASMLGSDGTIKNSAVSNTTITQKGTGAAYAMTGSGTVNNSSCSATITAPKSDQIKTNGFNTIVFNVQGLGFDANNFTVSSDGSVSYSGTAQIAKLKVAQTVTIDRLHNGVFENGGFPTVFVDSTEFTNVASGTTLNNAVDYVTDIKNVTNEEAVIGKLYCVASELPSGLEFNKYGFVFYNGTLYLNANQGEAYSSNYFAGTLKTSSSDKITITVYYTAYDAQNNLLGTVANSYTVNINK